ncbi:Polyketide synthase [Mycena venus]|uniref:Polyketide synthase n=1 Tax=Mycena venus TaxID=2733690 RepID=A0A8H6XIB3_9AGAR|nr:Polyketide synthase [Mycena venus]
MELDKIAIVGQAVQLPSGSTSSVDLDYTSFWDFLMRGEKAYEPLDNIDILADSVHHETKVQLPTQGTFLKNATSFDNIALGVSTKDARVMPYSARRLLDLSFQALLDSGVDSRHCEIGCFMSGSLDLADRNTIDTEGSVSAQLHSIANRISYALDLTGPSVYLDTACNSSLTALHLAIGAIQRGDCAAALVGAAQINRDLSQWTTYVQTGVLAPDGMCRPLDAAGAGFGRGEGAVVIVLKTLKEALRDNDHIYCVVLGSAINATGSGMPPNVPNGAGQGDCIRKAYRRSGFKPADADYVELHATGTIVGDPIKANTAGSIFSKDQTAVFGGLKGNIGHLEVASFMASLVKACLIFENGTIPPTVNFSRPVDAINWDAFRIVVPVEPTPLGCRSSSGRSIISVTGFGIGGTMGHVVLQAPPPRNQTGILDSVAPVLFLVGGLSSHAVDQISHAILGMDIDDSETLRKCAVTLSRRARQLPWRKYMTVPISTHITDAPAALIPPESSPLAFVFSGQGPQHLEMGRQLFAEYPVFRKTILDLDAVYRRVRGVSLIESTGLFVPVGSQSSTPTVTLENSRWPVVIAVSAIAMVQMAMFDLCISAGIVPDMVLGHSAGETACLYASGAGSKEMAMEIAIARGESMTVTESEEVGMAMLACNTNRVSELISLVTDGVGVLEQACFNAPDSVTVSGGAALLDKLVGLAKRDGIFAQRIRTMLPAHSSYMDCIKKDFLARMDDIFARHASHAPRIPVYSTCHKEKFVEAFTASYFWDNCRNPVLFSKAISDLLPSSPVFVEISCHPVLSSSILSWGVPLSRVLCPMRRVATDKAHGISSTEPEVFLDTLGRLSLLGSNSLDLSGLYGPSTFKSKLIVHPLAIRNIPPPKSLSLQLRSSTADNSGPLSSSNLRITHNSHPDLAEHIIDGVPILPATGFIELLLESGANFLWDVEFLSILSLKPISPVEIELQRLNEAWSITTSIASREQEHARGFMDRSTPKKNPAVLDYESIFKHLPLLDFEGFYHSLEPFAAYGPRFQRVVRCHGGPLEVISEIQGPTPDELSDRYVLHPVVMDACLHGIAHTDLSKQYSKSIMYLPSRLDHFIFYRRKYGTGNWISHITLRHSTTDSRSYDVLISDSAGVALCELRNLTLRKFTSTGTTTVNRRFDLIFQPVAVNVNLPVLPTSFPARPDEHETELLHKALDCMALDTISESLSHDLVIGNDESRRRYLQFARRVVQERNDLKPLPGALTEFERQVAALFRDDHPHFIGTQIRRAVDVLYSDDLMTKFYSRDSQHNDVCIETAKAFSGILKSFRESGKRVVKILEVGAGTGLLTYHLIDEMKQHPDLLVEYTLTDISYALVAELARNIASVSVVPKAYDIGKDPGAQGIHADSYDVVVGLHVLHAAPIVDGTGWVNKPGSVWYDFIFGSFAEWFGYVDGRDHCTLPPTVWKEHLEAVDFINVQTCVERGANGRDFFFMAQKSFSCSMPAPDVHTDLRHIYPYEFGKEIELQRRLAAIDTAVASTVYVLALRGRDADSALGLCAVLRKEVPSWDLRLAIFESSVELSNPTPLLIRHIGAFIRGENVISFDRDGTAHVPRVALSPPPASTEQHCATHVIDDPADITVRIIQSTGISRLYNGFVGQVVQSDHPGVFPGEFVGGVVQGSPAEVLRVPINNIISTTKNTDVDYAGRLLGAILSSLINWSSLGPRTRVAVAIENERLASIVGQHGSIIPGIQVLLPDFRDPDISELVDLLVIDSVTYAQHNHLHRWIPRSGIVLLWDQVLTEIIRNDPSHDGHFTQVAPPSIPESIPVQPSRSRAAPPFRGDRAYVLLGGIGGLGVDLAVWMYKHGARHLVLTSRRGLDSLDPIEDAITVAKVTYLRTLDGLHLRLDKCDATDAKQMHLLLHSLPVPIAGCFHMTLVLSDRSFFKQTADTFRDVHNSKLGVFEVFSGQVEIESLDFFVALSSLSGLVGIPGQSNYSSACTALDGILAHYPNAFSLITPGIIDAGYLARASSNHIDRKNGMGNISAEDLWAYLEDGLRKMDDCPFNQYIPDMDWSYLDRRLGLPIKYSYILHPDSVRPAKPASQPQNGEGILAQVLELFEVSLSDFDPTQPLTTYGLDSISAAKLASILHPYSSFSQLQLLGGITWAEIEAQLQDPAQPVGDSSSGKATLVELPDPTAQPLVEICSGSGTPLIILPGITGSIGVFYGLQKHFKGALWGIQLTESTPLQSFEGLVGFWKQQICEKWPHGPYRFAAFSAGTLFGVALTKMMEDAGKEVVQLTFVDHCPVLWAREEAAAIFRADTAVEFRHLADEFGDVLVNIIADDPVVGSEIIDNFRSALCDLPAPISSRIEIENFRALMPLVFKFLQQLCSPNSEDSHTTFIEALNTWMSSLNAPMTVLIAEYGIVCSQVGDVWPDLGASSLSKPPKVHYVNGVGHFGLFGDERVAQILYSSAD